MKILVDVNISNTEVEKAYNDYINAKRELERCLHFERVELKEEAVSEEADTAL